MNQLGKSVDVDLTEIDDIIVENVSGNPIRVEVVKRGTELVIRIHPLPSEDN